MRARRALTADAGKLWGAPLNTVPWLGVDGHSVLLTQAPAAEDYAPTMGVWKGPLPASIAGSNSSVNWAGRMWAMVQLPLPGDSLVTQRLLIHEAMHALQPAVLPAPPYSETATGAGILDEASGRTSLRLEWRALTRALRFSGAERDSALHDALLFRAARYAISAPDEITRERAMDVKEGIPEYTAWKLSGSPRVDFLASVDSAPAKMPSFVRSFVYYTGPAYAMLLDDYTGGAWRRSLSAHPDLETMAAEAIASRHFTNAALIRAALVSKPDGTTSSELVRAARTRSLAYGGAEIVAEENTRWARRQQELARYRTEFLDGPTIRVQSRSLSISFDPRRQASLGDSGTVMANLAWKNADGSSLSAPDGALINQSFSELRVPRGDAHLAPGVITQLTTVHGDGWTLVLAPGWVVRAKGNSLIVTHPKP
jgi:hypothetical protein